MAVASSDLQAMVRDWTQTQIKFYDAVWYLGQIQKRMEVAQLSDEEVMGEFSIDSRGQWNRLHGLRKDLRAKMVAIGERVRSELEGIL
jgi:hypothetical protein